MTVPYISPKLVLSLVPKKYFYSMTLIALLVSTPWSLGIIDQPPFNSSSNPWPSFPPPMERVSLLLRERNNYAALECITGHRSAPLMEWYSRFLTHRQRH